MPTEEYTVRESEIVEFKKRRYIRILIQNAMRKGEVVKAKYCDLCGGDEGGIDAHHVDYGKPYQITWVCSPCHGIVHRKEHPLNPENNQQTNISGITDRYEFVTVAFTLPVKNYLILKAESEKVDRPIARLIREQTMSKYPVKSRQMEFDFTKEKTNDVAQEVQNPRVSSVAENESVLPKPKRSILPAVRRKRNIDMPRMEGELLNIFARHGSDAAGMQRAFAR